MNCARQKVRNEHHKNPLYDEPSSRSAPGITRRRRRSSFQLCFAVALLCYETQVVELISYAKFRKLLNIGLTLHLVFNFLVWVKFEIKSNLDDTSTEMVKYWHPRSTFIQQAFKYFFWFWFIYFMKKLYQSIISHENEVLVTTLSTQRETL